MAHEISLDGAGAIAEITLSGPQGNSLDREGIEALQASLLELRTSSTLRAVILTGAEGAFCGGRIRDRSLISKDEIATDLAPIIDLNRIFEAYPLPVLSAVEGQAFGFGFGLAMLSDVAVAGESAQFALTELAHGIPPLIVLSYLFRLVPYKVAFDLSLTGRMLAADEAERLGLLTSVVPDGTALGRARELAALIAGTDATAIALLKQYARSNASLVDDAAAVSGADKIAALLAANTPH